MTKYIPFEFPKSKDGRYIAILTEDRILFNRRNKLGLTQQQVADMAGIPLRQYQRLESGTSDLSTTTATIALSVCSVLLLDPFEMVRINAKSPDPSSLRRQDFFDSDKSESHLPKHAGRKPIQRDVMNVYFNHLSYSMLIPKDVLINLGKPSCIQIRWIATEKRALIYAIDEACPEGIDVPDSLYGEKDAALAVSSPILLNNVRKHMGWNDSTYAVECRLVRDAQGTLLILCEMDTARLSQKTQNPFTIIHA